MIKKRIIFSKYEKLFLLLILLISTFLHFYLLNTHLHFNLDEGYMSFTIRNIIYLHHFPTVGPGGSIGNGIYHGAFFYYLFLIPGILSNFNPLGFAYFVVILSIISDVLLYISIREVYGKLVSILTVIFYVFSYNVIVYSRWEWNPNTIPFFTILSLFSLIYGIKTYKDTNNNISNDINNKESVIEYLRKRKSLIYFSIFYFSIGAITQLHIAGWVMYPVAILILFDTRKYIKNIRYYLIYTLSFLFPMIPTIFHELKYKFPMIKGILLFILQHKSGNIFISLSKGIGNYAFFINDIFKIPPEITGFLTIFGIFLIYLEIKENKKEKINSNKKNHTYTDSDTKEMISILSKYILYILFFAYIMYSEYPGDIHHIHYAEFLFPIFPLLASLSIIFLVRLKQEFAVICLIIVSMFIYSNLILFKEGIVNGIQEYRTENIICSDIKNSIKTNTADVNINNTINNPVYLQYICLISYNISLNSNSLDRFIVYTNWINNTSVIQIKNTYIKR